MANAFKNTTLITKIIAKHFINNLILAKKVDRQLDEQNIFSAKVGATAFIRRPVEFKVTDGAVVGEDDISDIEEATVPLTLDVHKKVVWQITSTQKTLNVEDITERYIKPSTKKLAQAVESNLAAQYINIPNFVGTAGTTPSTLLSIANAKRKLSELGVPSDDGMNCAFWSPNARVNLADGLKAVFPQKIATEAIEKAEFGYYGGFDNYECQSLINHTVGINTGTPLVNGATQETTYALSKDTQTQTLNTDGWTNDTTAILKAGDVFNIADVFSVNREDFQSTGQLQDFTVTADADSGASTGPAALTISPPIIITGPYQTVDSSPANDAAITVLTGTGGTTHRQNLAFHKNCITLAFARLDIPDPDEGAKAYRVDFDGISIRGIYQYNAILDRTIFRWDILFGSKVQNPSMGVRITE